MKNPLAGHESGRILRSIALFALLGAALSTPADAGFTAKDAQILGRVLGFLDPAPPSSVTLALVYDSAASKAEADALAGQIAGKSGNFTLVPKVVKASDLGGSGANAILLMDGVSAGAATDAVKSKKIPCFTSDSALVKSGTCLISIKTDGKVEILVSGSLQKASGVGFGAAFRMMITEV
ncbi:MAG: hypothetical protein P4L57_06185 [Rhizomicrobium sp.]|nr:hypothetical protein [Rhizomicrobium sp.]